jgi:tetratricopeptide (TPR) repeat protein
MIRIIYIICLFICFSKSLSQNKDLTSLGIPNFTILGNTEDTEKYKWLEVGFSESLTDAFSRVPEFKLIERTQLIKVLEEQNLQNNKNIDTTSIVKAGRILGVKQILVGSCQIITGHTLVNLRIVNVETGEVNPLKNLPSIVTPIDSVLYLQKRICLEVLKQYKVAEKTKTISQIEVATSTSTNSLKAYEFLNKGLQLYSNGQFNEAIDMYNHALSIDKKYEKAYFKRGESNVKINNYNEGINDYKKVENYVKKDSVFSLIGDAYIKQGDKEKSIEYLVKAQKINPDNTFVKKLLNEITQNNYIVSNNKSSDKNFETIYAYSNGIARVKKNKKYGFIDINGSIVIPLIYDDLRDFKNGFAAAKLNSKWGFINQKGLLAIDAKYSEISDFDKYKLARVEIKDKWGIIDSSGKEIIPIEFISFGTYVNWESNDLFVTYKYTNILKLNYVAGVYDRSGKNIIPLVYDDIFITFYRNNNDETTKSEIYASLNKLWGMIDNQNKIIIPFAYETRESIRGFINEFAAVKENERWGFVNRNGLLVIPLEFEKVNDFDGNIFEVRNKGKWGIIDSNFKQILSCEFDNIKLKKNKYYSLLKENKLGIFSSDLNKYTPCDYEEIDFNINEYFKLKKDGLWGIYSKELFEILPCNYEEIIPFTKNKFKVKNNNKIGIVNYQNKLEVSIEYDDLTIIEGKYIAAKKNNKWGIIDNINNIICDFKYDKIEYFRYSDKLKKNEDSIEFYVTIKNKKYWVNNKCKCLYFDCE